MKKFLYSFYEIVLIFTGRIFNFSWQFIPNYWSLITDRALPIDLLNHAME